MTYTELTQSEEEVIESQPVNVKKAMAIIAALKDRKGFDGWFDMMDPEFNDEVFDEIVEIIEGKK